jgi:hypothetical protein
MIISFTPLLSLQRGEAVLRDDLHLEKQDPTGSFQSHSGLEDGFDSFRGPVVTVYIYEYFSFYERVKRQSSFILSIFFLITFF